MKSLALLASLFFFQVSFGQVIPYRQSEKYEIRTSLDFKSKSANNVNTITFESDKGAKSGALQAFFKVEVDLIKMEDDYRLKVLDNFKQVMVSKKVKTNMTIELDLGFVQDMKERVTPHQFTISFLNRNKQVINNIKLEVQKDGGFLVNDEVFGKL